MRVLLTEQKNPLQFHSLSAVELSSGHDKIVLTHARTDLSVRRVGDMWAVLVIAKNFHNEYKLQGPSLSVRSLELQWQGHKLEFPIRIGKAGNRLQLVATMPMDRYLRGVIAHEMPSSWPLEALKAQVIASRTYALWKKTFQRHENYDLKPSVLDQVFRLNRSGESDTLPPSVERALAETEDMYLVNRQQKAVKTYFHADCGGATDSADQVWGEGAGLHSARDVACEKRASQWTSRWEGRRLRSRLLTEFFLPQNLELVDIIVRSQLNSKRASGVDLMFSKGIFKRVRGEDLRRVLGYDKLKSTLFRVQKQGDSWVFAGRGFGHGVGMCQWGAKSLAQTGHDFKAILSHYYPGAQLKHGLQSEEMNQSVSSL